MINEVYFPSAYGTKGTGGTDMDSFDARGDSLEAKFAYDQELQFKMIAKRNYRLGIVAAAQLLGKSDSDD